MTKAESTRQFIIEKSAPIFNTKGIAGTSMSDIMEATKLAKGSLYVHFENKDDLAYCTVDYILKTLAARRSAAVNKSGSMRESLYSLMDSFADPISSPVIGGCPIINFGMEADDTNPIVLEKVNNAVKNFQKMVAAIVDEGISSGEFKKEWNSKEFAIKTFAMLEGGILISRITGNRNQMKIIINILKKEIGQMSS